MPRTGSYGETPTVTRSPGTTLIRKRRMRPLNWARTSWPWSHCTRYKPPLWTATTVPCTSIRSSLLNCYPFQSKIVPHLPPFRKLSSTRLSRTPRCLEACRAGRGGVVGAFQAGRRPERDTCGIRARGTSSVVQDAVETLEPDRNDRDAEPGGDHRRSGLELADARRPPSGGPPGRSGPSIRGNQLANISQRLPRARFPLRERERVEEQRGEVVVRAVGEPRRSGRTARGRSAP